jgi:uncharacterized protein YjiS (DUF1127 family)
MTTLAFALIPSAMRREQDPSHPEADQSFLGKLLLRLQRRVRYERALRELRRIDARDLDDLNLGQADLPALAWRHAAGMQPLARQQD